MAEPIAPGLPGGADPAMVGIGNQNPLRPGAAVVSAPPAPKQPTVPAIITAGPAAEDVNKKMGVVNDLAASQVTTPTPMATLVNPTTGDRKAVPVGSQQAQGLFGSGYILETKGGAGPAAQAPAAPIAPPAPPTPTPTAPAAPARTNLTNKGSLTVDGGRQEFSDGTYSNSSLAGSPIYDQAGNVVGKVGEIPAGAAVADTATDTDRNIANFTARNAEITAKSDAAFEEFQNSVNQMRNGTFPLSPDQQAQIDGIAQQFQSLLERQKVANRNYEGAVKQAGISAGRNMYAPEVELGTVNSAVNAGVSALADINVRMSMAISDARQAFQESNFKMLDNVYTKLQDYLKDQREVVNSTYEKAKDALAGAQQKFDNDMREKEFEFEVQKYLESPGMEADKAAQQVIFDMYREYPDAGIDPFADSMTTAADKVKNSASYIQKQKEKQQADIEMYDYAVKNGYTGTFLEFLQRDKDTGPIEVGGYLIDRDTHKILFAPPEKATTYSLSPGERVYDSTGLLLAENPAAAKEGRVITLSPGEVAYDEAGNEIARGPVSSEPPKVVSVDGVDMTWDAAAGEYVPAPVSGDKKNEAYITSLQGKVGLIDEILDNEALSGTVGVLPFGRTTFDPSKLAARTDFLAAIANLVGKEALASLLDLKKQGGTLGALSEKELKILEEASTKIGYWAQKDEGGNIQSVKTGEAEFRRELQKLKLSAQNAIDLANGFTYDPEDSGYAEARADKANSTLTNKQIWESLYPPGKASEGSGSRNAQAKVQDLKIGDKTVKVAGTIAGRLARADADFFRATGKHIQINEAFRTRERQTELYEKSKRGEIGRAAPPGHSFHEKGLAVDVQNWKEAEKYLRKYGLVNDLDDDKNHFSYGETNNIG